MKTANKIQKIFYTFLFLICINTAFATDPPPTFDDDVVDVPPAPIDDYIMGAVVLAFMYGFFVTKKTIKT